MLGAGLLGRDTADELGAERERLLAVEGGLQEEEGGGRETGSAPGRARDEDERAHSLAAAGERVKSQSRVPLKVQGRERAHVKPWQMTVESGRRRRLEIDLSYRLRSLAALVVEKARLGTGKRAAGGRGTADDDEGEQGERGGTRVSPRSALGGQGGGGTHPAGG